jgi:Uma2 family endonuclease
VTTTLESQPSECLLLHGISWTTYERLLVELEESHQHHRLTYDDGDLEIMSPSPKHERFKKLMGRLIEAMTEELRIPISSGGSTTFKSALLKKGLEPDECYWIANEAKVRGMDEFVWGQDPPPDLAVEVDITRSALRRFGIYASLGIPEIWRWKKNRLVFHELVPATGANGDYREIAKSRSFPFLGPEPLTRFLLEAHATDETTWILKFRAWVREELSGHERKS